VIDRKSKILSFDEIVDRIKELTGLQEEEVRYRVWTEALDPGANVSFSALEFGVTPHVYNTKMENFYRSTDAFIFEIMVESCRKGKRKVMDRVRTRMKKYIEDRRASRINTLMFGDGIGLDTIFLHENFDDRVKLYYFDVPGSKTFDFACKLFKKYNIPVDILTDIKYIPQNFFDVVICFEVLEHLPEPLELISGISAYLKNNGIALITESFGAVIKNFPTHLKSNLKYENRTPFLFLKNSMILSWYPINDLPGRPMEFVKKSNLSQVDKFKYKVRLFSSKHIMFSILKRYIKQILKRFLRG